MAKAIDATGQRFGKLIAVKRDCQEKNQMWRWECLCDCGKTTSVRISELRSGNVSSCGCAKEVDLTGQRFGKLVAICRDYKDKNQAWVWKCKCDCGKICYKTTHKLKAGLSDNCGCVIPHDITGQKFGRLTVIKRDHQIKKGEWIWECRCDCGNITYSNSGNLTSGNTTSCGCWVKELLASGNNNRIHSLSHTRVHSIWRGILTRCSNPNRDDFKYYGGRGIIICEEWRNHFKAFYDWAMSHGYSDDLAIERVDVNGNYCPKNCTWIPMPEQAKNTRRCLKNK